MLKYFNNLTLLFFLMISTFLEDFANIFMQNPIGQFFGLLGTLIIVYGFMQTDDNKSKLIIVIAGFIWILHYGFMGLYLAMISATIGIFRVWLSIKYKKNLKIFYTICGISLLFGFFNYDGIISILPVITSIGGAIGYFLFEKIKMRLISMFNSILWFIYAINVGSIGGMINEVLVQFILIITIIRMITPDGQKQYYKEKVVSILLHKPNIDLGRFVILRDRNKIIRKKGYLKIIKTKINKIFKSYYS